ncbi:MAG: anaerobic glycerol-3-phosphate dehydrogenase subunit A [Methanomassiliicoccales archaeon]|nr:anaerobic glycerol-3-phosphate dehydrogenase subunit A [Methanomassiliicoccales archaeon]
MSKVDVLIVGGGVTGAGIARDLALRGTGVMLLEKSDFSTGATGRSHGMLHSGGRYAVKDPESAAECAKESAILRRIAGYCIEDTGGLFVGLEDDDPDFPDRFLRGCADTGVQANVITPEEARSIEPRLSEKIESSIEVHDASVDPFALTIGNVEDARDAGADVRNYCLVEEFSLIDGRIQEVIFENLRNGSRESVRPEIVVNAGGAWADCVASLAGLHIPMEIDKGTLVVLNGRLVNRLVNRLRMPSDGDIIVPNHSASIIGTTSKETDTPENTVASRSDVDHLILETSKMVPDVALARAVRAYVGVRPLPGEGKGGRDASRTFKVIDHAEEGVENFLSILGGKLTTYRLMAERMSDLVSHKLGSSGNCRTALEPISLPMAAEQRQDMLAFPMVRMTRKYGKDYRDIVRECVTSLRGKEVLCSCEEVLRGEVEYFTGKSDVIRLSDLMRRTRAGMGYCQAGMCAFTLASVMIGHSNEDPLEIVGGFLKERWRGVEPVLLGAQLRQEVFNRYLHDGVYHLESLLRGEER